MILVGFDIGGTKCAVSVGTYENDEIIIESKEGYPTDFSITPQEMILKMCDSAEKLLCGRKPDSIGISCGGPLNSTKGVILSPPNLPGWDEIYAVDIVKSRFDCPVSLENDANACALAEWKFGSGKGSSNMAFMTFGTGLGAGLILDGRLYRGTTDMAGEVGHIRLAPFGPIGYGKRGSFEGFCSGAGIAQLGDTVAKEYLQKGIKPSYYCSDKIASAKEIAQAARDGDEAALEVFNICGTKLGEGLSVMIDILNLERIVIGSIFTRCEDLLREAMNKVIDYEALYHSKICCQVLPAALGEKIGDYAAVAIAVTNLEV
ncbi:MAG: ROK family protein [Acutalibacteraceae bacterium]|nr:ROK family protein [Acutalibacteraceae bacterium]